MNFLLSGKLCTGSYPTVAKLFLLGATLLSLTSAGSISAAKADDAPAGEFRTLPGFEVELVYNVSANDQGSWVSMCLDDKGRILASDQYGKLYRVNVDGEEAKVEELSVNIGLAQGMLYAFDSLYININARKKQLEGTDAEGPGVYRLRDTTGDDQFDKIEYIVPMTDKAGEHGPHALILSPDGKQIYFCSGNQVDVPESAKDSLVPKHWDEDHLLGRLPDARGHMKGVPAPGGWICRMNPDGTDVELIATGFRNEYDIAFNKAGDLFAYDADMEWDIGSPWYRPTRVNHVISGAEFGWRNGTGKWPDHYGDSFGAVVNIGPGSPTGISFGYGTKFPKKYQDALFICDWSYGSIHAVHMTPDGATYTGEYETFVTAAPMAVTDVVVRPQDGMMYFAVGGRRTASGLYRVKHDSGNAAGEEFVASTPAGVMEARQTRAALEAFHGRVDASAVKPAVQALGSSDRSIRFAARIALEHQPLGSWREAVLESVSKPQEVITAAYALARSGSKQDQEQLIQRLTALPFGELETDVKLELLRALQLVWIRLGEPTPGQTQSAIAQLDGFFPGENAILNRELAAVLVYLNAPSVIDRCVEQMQTASAQEDQIHYAFCLRNQKEGWNENNRLEYFRWFFDVASARGGASFGGFLTNIRKAALENLDEAQLKALGELAGKMPAPRDPLEDLTPRDMVAEWSVEALQEKLAEIDVLPDFDAGRSLTATAQCFKCHRFKGQGGIQGPDLTAAGKRFNDKDMLTAIIEPNKEVSDQYQATQFLTDNGVVVGRVANLNGDKLQVVTNMLDPGNFTSVMVDEIIERRPAPNSMMPSGLLDTFKPDEVAQMLAYLKSGGDANHPIYQSASKAE
ncbi:MAG: L-sorbosone dehydrogenase [Pirellulaceae bacterium]